MAGRKQPRTRGGPGSGKGTKAKTGDGTVAKAKDSSSTASTVARAKNGSSTASTVARAKNGSSTASMNRPNGGGSGRSAAAVARPVAKPAQTKRARDRARARELAAGNAAAEPALAGPPLWLQLTSLVLSVGGLAVSIYLTIEHFTGSTTLACSDKGVVNCLAVTQSPEAMVFGVFPVAVLGLAFYVFMVAANTPMAWRSPRREIALARLASVIVGVGFILYLIYVELFRVSAICLWCTGVHVITFLLFVLVMLATAVWGLPKAAKRTR